MSTKSDFKMFSEAYDSIYKEADLSDNEALTNSIESGNPTGQFTSSPPSSNKDLPAPSGNPKLNAANTALQALQASLTQLPNVDPTIQQYLEGIAGILQNHAPAPSNPSVA